MARYCFFSASPSFLLHFCLFHGQSLLQACASFSSGLGCQNLILLLQQFEEAGIHLQLQLTICFFLYSLVNLYPIFFSCSCLCRHVHLLWCPEAFLRLFPFGCSKDMATEKGKNQNLLEIHRTLSQNTFQETHLSTANQTILEVVYYGVALKHAEPYSQTFFPIIHVAVVRSHLWLFALTFELPLPKLVHQNCIGAFSGVLLKSAWHSWPKACEDSQPYSSFSFPLHRLSSCPAAAGSSQSLSQAGPGCL